MSLPPSLQTIKNDVAKYFSPVDWPWEIISGLFIILLLINNFKTFSKDYKAADVAIFCLIIIAVNFLWGLIDGLMFVFTSLLEKGRYNKMVLTLKTDAKESIRKTLANDLNQTIVGMMDKYTAQQIIQILLNKIALTDATALKKPRITQDDITGALLHVFFVFLPGIVILPFFFGLSFISIDWAIWSSNVLGSALFFAFGYKLGSCTNHNKILTGAIFMIVDLVIIMLAVIIGA